MQITGKNGLGSSLKKVLQISLLLGTIVVIILPFILNKIGISLIESVCIIYPNGVALIVITDKFIKLFDSLKLSNPFNEKNIIILKQAGITSVISSAFWLIDLLYEIIIVKSNNFVLLLTFGFFSLLFFGVFIALYMLSELFKQATEYKQENELTI